MAYDPLAAFRHAEQERAVRRALFRTVRRTLVGLLALLGALSVARMVTGCAGPSDCPYDVGCYERTGGGSDVLR